MRLAFADSEVAGVQAEGGCIRVRFAAAAVEPSAPGEEGGWLLGLVLELDAARGQGEPGRCFGRLRQGELADATTRFTAIELPFDGPGPWQAEFDFANGERLQVAAARASALIDRGERFQASYAC